MKSFICWKSLFTSSLPLHTRIALLACARWKKQFKNIFFHLPSYWLKLFSSFRLSSRFSYNFIKRFSSSPLSIKLRTNRISLRNTEKWWDESSAVGERWLGCVLFHILFNCVGKKGADSENTLVHTSFSSLAAVAAAVLFTLLLLTRNWIKNSSSRFQVISHGGRYVCECKSCLVERKLTPGLPYGHSISCQHPPLLLVASHPLHRKFIDFIREIRFAKNSCSSLLAKPVKHWKFFRIHPHRCFFMLEWRLRAFTPCACAPHALMRAFFVCLLTHQALAIHLFQWWEKH